MIIEILTVACIPLVRLTWEKREIGTTLEKHFLVSLRALCADDPFSVYLYPFHYLIDRSLQTLRPSVFVDGQRDPRDLVNLINN